MHASVDVYLIDYFLHLGLSLKSIHLLIILFRERAEFILDKHTTV